ncbi:hypothetical protein LIS82_08960 [Cytobacillus solani]|uniref:hypothetical protein n=1 Tax=Cytobacillus solani TaxID=1637975 RepID=UPI00207A5801|nr:hypothetical protein [Cytobacillus solani]USK56581.1 hypothetical protein LIS82_08960 [Cytobacillus solani]
MTNIYENDIGKWIITEGGSHILIESSQDWLDKHRPEEEPPSKSPLDIIGEQLVEKDIRIMELEAQNDDMGQQIVEKDIQILQLESRQSDIGQQIVDLDIRLMEGGL